MPRKYLTKDAKHIRQCRLFYDCVYVVQNMELLVLVPRYLSIITY